MKTTSRGARVLFTRADSHRHPSPSASMFGQNRADRAGSSADCVQHGGHGQVCTGTRYAMSTTYSPSTTAPSKIGPSKTMVAFMPLIYSVLLLLAELARLGGWAFGSML